MDNFQFSSGRKFDYQDITDSKAFPVVKGVAFTVVGLLMLAGTFKLLGFVFSSYSEMKNSFKK